jgi:hypothetical protein
MHWIDRLSLASISTGIAAIATDATFTSALSHFPWGQRALGIVGIIGVVTGQLARIKGAPSTSTQTVPPQTFPYS